MVKNEIMEEVKPIGWLLKGYYYTTLQGFTDKEIKQSEPLYTTPQPVISEEEIFEFIEWVGRKYCRFHNVWYINGEDPYTTVKDFYTTKKLHEIFLKSKLHGED